MIQRLLFAALVTIYLKDIDQILLLQIRSILLHSRKLRDHILIRPIFRVFIYQVGDQLSYARSDCINLIIG